MSTAAHASDPISTHTVAVPTPEQLPNDLDTLKRMIIELATTLRQERRDKEALRHRIHLLLQRFYGPRTERVNPDQLLLFTDWAAAVAGTDTVNTPSANAPSADAASADAARPPARPRKSTPHGRRKPPENLQRQPVHHQLCEAERLCVCGQLRVEIGTEISEQFDWQPASLVVWQHIVHKYLCRDCAKDGAKQDALKSAEEAMTSPDPSAKDQGAKDTAAKPIGPAIISAPKPPPPIAKGLPGAGLLAYVIVSKYFDHLPLYRLERIFARQGATISRSTMCDWMAKSAQALRPLYELMVAEVLQSQWLHTDDTPVKNQGHEPGTTALSRFWIYWGDRTHPYNVFDFTINRKRDGPQKFLADFHGYLQADAFSGYDALYLPERRGATGAAAPIIEVACNAHARRKFYEARGSDDLRAHLALGYYRSLYELERGATAAGLDDEGRRRMRQEISRHFLDQFHAWLEEQRPQVLPKSPIAEAINYALNNWTALTRYTEAGFLSIDNNTAEREMKRIAIGRKNWLFVGSDRGGQTAAILFSFTSTCHRLGVEPWAYLQDVLTRLPALASLPAERRAKTLAELLPDRWAAARVKTIPAPAPSA